MTKTPYQKFYNLYAVFSTEPYLEFEYVAGIAIYNEPLKLFGLTYIYN